MPAYERGLRPCLAVAHRTPTTKAIMNRVLSGFSPKSAWYRTAEKHLQFRTGTPNTVLTGGLQGRPSNSTQRREDDETASRFQTIARARYRVCRALARARRHRLCRTAARSAAQQRHDSAGERSLVAGEGLP